MSRLRASMCPFNLPPDDVRRHALSVYRQLCMPRSGVRCAKPGNSVQGCRAAHKEKAPPKRGSCWMEPAAGTRRRPHRSWPGRHRHQNEKAPLGGGAKSRGHAVDVAPAQGALLAKELTVKACGTELGQDRSWYAGRASATSRSTAIATGPRDHGRAAWSRVALQSPAFQRKERGRPSGAYSPRSFFGRSCKFGQGPALPATLIP
jgi:hypothetical protein